MQNDTNVGTESNLEADKFEPVGNLDDVVALPNRASRRRLIKNVRSELVRKSLNGRSPTKPVFRKSKVRAKNKRAKASRRKNRA